MQFRQIPFRTHLGRFGSSALFASGLPPRRPVRIDIGVLPLTEPVLADLRSHVSRRRPVDIVLSTELCLSKIIGIPHAARRAAIAAIDMQLRQQMPSRAAGLIWRSEPLGRVEVTQRYRVHIFKQQELADLLKAAGTAGAEVRSVSLATPAPLAPLFERRTRADRITTFWNGLAACLSVVALGGALALQARATSALETRSAALDAEIAGLLDRAAAEKARLVERDELAAGLLNDVKEFNDDYRRFPVLADLTESLGDGVWISSLTLDSDVMRLVGFSRMDLAETVRVLQDAPWAEEVAVDGPVVVDTVRRENRFQLRVTLRPAGISE